MAEPTVDQATPIRAGVLVWNQYTSWPAMRDAGARIDALGYDSLWTWDHLYPIIGDPHGPFLEGYMVLAGWSQQTSRVTLGLLVGAYRSSSAVPASARRCARSRASRTPGTCPS
jgi:alkanesulfonate monooxygenase SsuD/methylene tetrahydromethanopterin reductase-like flavin-dependent oxidoreductase (luciferase family)